jgi:hypothetical protein
MPSCQQCLSLSLSGVPTFQRCDSAVARTRQLLLETGAASIASAFMYSTYRNLSAPLASNPSLCHWIWRSDQRIHWRSPESEWRISWAWISTDDILQSNYEAWSTWRGIEISLSHGSLTEMQHISRKAQKILWNYTILSTAHLPKLAYILTQ